MEFLNLTECSDSCITRMTSRSLWTCTKHCNSGLDCPTNATLPEKSYSIFKRCDSRGAGSICFGKRNRLQGSWRVLTSLELQVRPFSEIFEMDDFGFAAKTSGSKRGFSSTNINS